MMLTWVLFFDFVSLSVEILQSVDRMMSQFSFKRACVSRDWSGLL